MNNNLKDLETVANEVGLQRLSADVYGCGQLTEDQMRKACTVFKSVFNFRTEKEEGFRDDTKLVEELKGEYYLCPFTLTGIDEKTMDGYLAKLDTASRPCLVHCRSGFRAGMYSLNHTLSRSLTTEKSAISKEELLTEGKKVSVDLEKYDAAPLTFMFSYLVSKVEQVMKLGGVRQLDENLFVGPQLTEKQFKEAKEQGVKTVVNIRDVKAEAGNLGMGVLAREEEIIKKLGMQYLNFATTAQKELTPEEMETVLKALTSPVTQRPILLHCRTGKRSATVALAYMQQNNNSSAS